MKNKTLCQFALYKGEIEDMGNALNFMLEFCGGYEKCHECDFKNACYNLSKLADEFVSIGAKDDEE